jgi:hypothetical protein
VENVFFTEESVGLEVLGEIKVTATTQNTPLIEVKKSAAHAVIRLGGNGLMAYQYTQKADNPIKDAFLFKWDSERITVTGLAVRFDHDPREEKSA